jgi:hypothetical protein
MLEIDVDDVQQRLSADGEFLRYARQWTGSFGFSDGVAHVRVSLAGGAVSEVASGTEAAAADVVIQGPAEGWKNVFAAVPPPYYQDLLGGAVGRHGFLPAGDFSVLAAYYGAIQRAAVLIGQSLRQQGAR